jgi:hypothetical protein
MAVDVLVAAHDAGGAAALAPVLRVIHRGPRWSTATLAGGPARDILTGGGGPVIACGDLSRTSLASFVSTQLRAFEPRLLLTGTSLGTSLERALIRAARRTGTPTLALLDAWANYAARFKEPGEDALHDCHLPDAIAVMDDFAASEMEPEGFSPLRLRVVGHPDLDEFVRWTRSRAAADAAAEARAALQVPDAAPLIAYFSQPIAAIDRARGPEHARGYDEHDAWTAFAGAVARLPRPVTIAVKSHPADIAGQVSYPGAIGRATVKEVVGDAAHTLIAAADVVVGMTSVALVKAWLANRPVLSVQPGLRGPDLLVLGRMGLVKPIVNAADLPEALRNAVDGGLQVNSASVPATWTDGRAIERVVSLVRETLAR